MSAAQSDKQITKQILPQSEISNIENLTSLLSSNGISVDKAALLPARVNQSRTVRARWKSAGTASLKQPFTTEMAQEGSLSLLEIKPNRGGLARQRSLELSPTQVLVVMVNQNNQVLWWDLMSDPRLLRAETADANGLISGKTLYSTNAELLVSYPADETITELRFYHPDWDGQSYSLKLIGNLFVASAAK
ncbi:MAG: hypothetical protein ACR2MG_14880 [Pyrinomonadaceae bacterium]